MFVCVGEILKELWVENDYVIVKYELHHTELMCWVKKQNILIYSNNYILIISLYTILKINIQ